MKKLILLLTFLVFIGLGFSASYYSLDNTKIFNSSNNCLNITILVNSSLPIDDGEYSLINCNSINLSYWECSCNGIELVTKINTLNNYTFNINESIKKKTSSGSSSSNSYETKVIFYDVDNKVETIKVINNDSIKTSNNDSTLINEVTNVTNSSINNNSVEPVKGDLNSKDTKPHLAYIIISVALVILVLMIIIIS
jgi:hypothetical protein